MQREAAATFHKQPGAARIDAALEKQREAVRALQNQLALAFPKPTVTVSVNNRAMSGNGKNGSSDPSDADKQDAAKKLRNKALRLLTTREHSREELMRKLAQAKARRARDEAKAPPPDKDDIERLADDLAAQGWQSDDRYAEAIVRRFAGQASRRFISEKLAQAGIKKDIAQNALEALDQDEMDVARALWARRFGDAPKDDKERQKQIRFLLSRGFHLGDAFKLVPRAPVLARDAGADAGIDATAGEPLQPGGALETTRTSTLGRNKPARSTFGRSRPWGRKNDRDDSGSSGS